MNGRTNMKRTIACMACFLTIAISTFAGENAKSTLDIIRYGVTHSTLIISGTFAGTAEGGGGATSSVDIREVLKATKDYHTPKQVVVYWLSEKPQSREINSKTSFLFFLRPASANTQGGYFDVTEKMPFIQATESNVRLLKSMLDK